MKTGGLSRRNFLKELSHRQKKVMRITLDNKYYKRRKEGGKIIISFDQISSQSNFSNHNARTINPNNYRNQLMHQFIIKTTNHTLFS